MKRETRGAAVPCNGQGHAPRRYPRVAYAAPVQYAPLTGEGGPPVGEGVRSGELMDVGGGGVALLAEGPAPPARTVVKVWVPLAGLPLSVPVLALIVWAVKAKRGMHQLGLQFVF